jgi:Molecular chaperone, HSP90 family
VRFASTHTESPEQTVSLADYVARMKPEQTKIYYVTADTWQAATHSPHLEVFRKKGVEVLLLTDRVDEWMLSFLNEFDGKPLQSVRAATRSGRVERRRKAGAGEGRRGVQAARREDEGSAEGQGQGRPPDVPPDRFAVLPRG